MSVPVALLFAPGMSGWVLHQTQFVFQGKDHNSILVDTEISFSGSNRRCVLRIHCFSPRLIICPEKVYCSRRIDPVTFALRGPLPAHSTAWVTCGLPHAMISRTVGVGRVVTSQPRANNQQFMCKNSDCSQQTRGFWYLTRQRGKADTQQRYAIIYGRPKQGESVWKRKQSVGKTA